MTVNNWEILLIIVLDLHEFPSLHHLPIKIATPNSSFRI